MSSMVYGNENWRSTGENSAHTVSMGVKTVLGRPHRVHAYWDEPDIGMSAGSAAGAGLALRELVDTVEAGGAPFVQAVCVTSHSPALVRALTKGLKGAHRPHYLYLGADKASGAPQR